jgi:DNA polymerase III delta prime subunit
MSTPGGFTFRKATKAQRPARIALSGPSGSGKTFTALRIAEALCPEGKRVGFVDTERRSGSLYAKDFDFDYVPLDTFNPEFVGGICADAAAQGIGVLLIDSMSHFWMGIDGMLEQVDNAGRRQGSGGNFGGWKEMRPVERRMIDALLAFDGHVIITMRVKTEYLVSEDTRGKKKVEKVGLKPEQREGIEYEFDLVADLDLEHNFIVSKTRCSALTDKVFRKAGPEVASTLLTWLGDGEAVVSVAEYADRANDPKATYAELRALHDSVKAQGLLNAAVKNDRGDSSTLGEIILDNGRAARRAEEVAEQERRSAEDEAGEAPAAEEPAA